MKEVEIGGVTYVPKGSQDTPVKKGMRYVIIRTENAGVFAGYLKSEKGGSVVLVDARRLWYWDGAASLSELAMEGVSKPESCKFPCEVTSVKLNEVIEILETTKKAYKSIKEVKVWTAKE